MCGDGGRDLIARRAERNNMDTTPEFISMVKAANLPWEWRVGDWAWDDIEKQTGIVIMHGQTIKVAWDNTAVMAFNPDANIIPLPRLDQLAEMLRGEDITITKKDNRLWSFWLSEDYMGPKDTIDTDTPEKLLLMAYMMKVNGKSWNGKKWA